MLAGARLTVLDLSDNAFGPDGVKGIERLLKSKACHTLQELRLNNCGMGIGGGKVSHSGTIMSVCICECSDVCPSSWTNIYVNSLLRSWQPPWFIVIRNPVRMVPPSVWRCLLQGGTDWRMMEPQSSLRLSRYNTWYWYLVALCLNFVFKTYLF